MRAAMLMVVALVAAVAPARAEERQQPAGEVKLTAEQRKLIDLKVEPARPGRVTADIVLNGEITADQERTVAVAARVAGIVREVPARVGDRVRSGATLAIMESAAGAEAEAAYAAARSKLGLAEAQAAREQVLFSKRVSPQQDLQVARQAASEAAIGLREADRKMRLLGLVPGRRGRAAGGPVRLAVTAPFDGTLIDRKVAAGDQVGEGAPLFQLANLDRVWVVAAAFERDTGQLRVGLPAKVTTAADPGRSFEGRVAWISDVLDERSRTLSVRVELENAERLLRPGSFAQVAVTPTGSPRGLVVPADAVLRQKADQIVFVQTADDTFQRREVKLGDHTAQAIEIVSGLQPGERVVTNGAFALLSELLKSSFGGDD